MTATKNPTSNKNGYLAIIFLIVWMAGLLIYLRPYLNNKSPQKSIKNSYSIVKLDDISFAGTKRLRVKILVDSLLNKNQITDICNEVILKRSYKEKKYRAIQFLFYIPDTDINGIYTCARSEWAPNGIWADAAKLKNNNYSNYRFNIELAKKVEWEDKTGLSKEKRMKIFYHLVLMEDSLNNVGSTKISERARNIIANKYNISSDVVEQIGNEGVVRNWPMP